MMTLKKVSRLDISRYRFKNNDTLQKKNRLLMAFLKDSIKVKEHFENGTFVRF